MTDRMTLKRASTYLNIPENTLRYYRTAGTGPASYRLCGRVFYDRIDHRRVCRRRGTGHRAGRNTIVNYYAV